MTYKGYDIRIDCLLPWNPVMLGYARKGDRYISLKFELAETSILSKMKGIIDNA